jgi:hypothetical protein
MIRVIALTFGTMSVTSECIADRICWCHQTLSVFCKLHASQIVLLNALSKKGCTAFPTPFTLLILLALWLVNLSMLRGFQSPFDYFAHCIQNMVCLFSGPRQSHYWCCASWCWCVTNSNGRTKLDQMAFFAGGNFCMSYSYVNWAHKSRWTT